MIISGDECVRHPTSSPVMAIASTVIAPNPRSAIVRPASTAPRAMGRERNRSMMPPCRSADMATVVVAHENATVWTKMPPIRNST